MLRSTTNIVGSSTASAARRVGGRRNLSTARRTTTNLLACTMTAGSRRSPPRASSSLPSLSTVEGRSFHTSRVWQSKKRETFKLADIGEGITECEVIKWSIQPGSRIEAFEPLCEVQSDKASVEITSPFDGIVKEILVPEGDIAKVGAGLCIIEVDGAAHPSSSSESDSKTPAEAVAENAEAAHAAKNEKAVPTEAPSKRGVHPLDPSNTTPRRLEDLRLGKHPSKGVFGSKKDESPSTSGFAPSAGSANVLAPPSIRHLAKLQGVDLAQLAPGSGKEGRIEMSDFEAYLARGAAPQAEVKEVSVQEPEPEIVVEMGRTRHNMYKAMVKSLEIPHFGYSTTLDITELHTMLPTLNAHIPAKYLPPSVAEQRQPLAIRHGMVNPNAILTPTSQPLPESMHYTKLTYLPVLLKTLSKAMMEWPLLRSTLASNPSSTKPSLAIRPSADIALALSTPTGLYTPTLSAVQQSSVYTLAATLKHLSFLGRQVPCALSPKEMPRRGGTLTVSNVGAVGHGETASPVLVPGGGVAIVALGRAKWVWDVNRRAEGERRLVLPVSWSADHRVVEGAELAAFVECWRGYVEDPVRMVAEGV
ncbi:2-oxoacid dehydrogenases acyltransferase-domain-containing protein [Ephemerocybe angulata]|uniref:Dihydrolipoamide acetyltransferase component of pyruvate dehydrogenase complex n=1 Tax=Ephemerocybe angulata TaxID=980116 RepID=A0A8H6MC97_9AGAR|nr:2-oxoacid dehydrogenases acyltransferase-domain-containing protein [Tulosesus angulatus]